MLSHHTTVSHTHTHTLSKKLLDCLVDPTARLQALGHLVMLFSSFFNCWVIDAGCWVIDAGCWVIGAGLLRYDPSGSAQKTRGMA
jgi:hypothetical protein